MQSSRLEQIFLHCSSLSAQFVVTRNILEPQPALVQVFRLVLVLLLLRIEANKEWSVRFVCDNKKYDIPGALALRHHLWVAATIYKLVAGIA